MTSFVEAGLGNALVALALAVVALVVGLLCRRPAVSHALWLLVLIKLVTPPLMSVPVPWPEEVPEAREEPQLDEAPVEVVEEPLVEGQEEPLPPESVEPIEESPTPELPYSAPSWQTVFGFVWLAGSLLWFGIAARRLWRFGRLLRHGRPASAELAARVAVLAKQLGLRKSPRILLVQGHLSPMVWAAGRVTLLVPSKLVAQMSAPALDTLLAHELAHIRRRDHWVRWLELVGLGLYWWNPVVWLARRELRQAEELCCDAWVVRCLPDARRVYATALVDALDFLSRPVEPVPALGCGLGRVDDLKWRLTMILRGQTSPRLGWTTVLGVFGLAVLMLPLVPGFSPAQPQAETRQTAQSKLEQLDPETRNKIVVEINALFEKRMAEAKARKADGSREDRAALQGRAMREDLDLGRLEIEVAKQLENVKTVEALLKKTKKPSDEHRYLADQLRRHHSALERANVNLMVHKRQQGITVHLEIQGAKDMADLQAMVKKIKTAIGDKRILTITVINPKDAPSHAERKPTPRLTTSPKQASPSTDDRIDVLEKKLDILMKHISTLEKSKARSSNGPGLFGRTPAEAPKAGTPPPAPRVPSTTPVLPPSAVPGDATPPPSIGR